MRLSRTLFVTLRHDPAEAEVRSHALMVRAGFLQRIAAGVYVYGPLLWRVIRKIEQIVREEHVRVGCQEVLLPALQPRALWEESGRWDRYVADGILYHFRDGRGREMCLGPTHEEVVTAFVRGRLTSYKQLPQTLFQIQTKFRDEIRPRFGLVRAREFVMKDAYSFDASAEGLARSYETMRAVYERIFTRCGLRCTVVQADSGAIGGGASEEFMVDAETGEDVLAVCPETGYAANLERAESLVGPPPPPPSRVPMHKEPTPAARSCEDLRRLFPDLPIERMLKTVLYVARVGGTEQVVAVMARGDRQINEIKLANVLGADSLALADEATVRDVTGAEVGFAGPIGLGEDVRLLADRSVDGVEGFLCGGNETDTHYLDVWFGRDLVRPQTHDFGLVQPGDRTTDGRGVLAFRRGIEVGHVFQLGTRYAEAMGATFADEDGRLRPFHMGCYGIGITRVAAAAIEQNHDEHGMIWPRAIAPYTVLLIQMRPGDGAQDALAEQLHDRLEAAGIDVLWDDRALGAGAKFKDADLVGIPFRAVIGREAARGRVEWGARTGPRETIAGDEVLTRLSPS
ncbi:MAG: proline--tRNA ligase [Planctomycetota bacterium]